MSFDPPDYYDPDVFADSKTAFDHADKLLDWERRGQSYAVLSGIGHVAPDATYRTALMMSVLLWEGRPKAALDLWWHHHGHKKQVVEPWHPELLRNLSVAHQMCGNDAAAAECLRVYPTAPDRGRVLEIRRVECHLRIGNFAHALSLFLHEADAWRRRPAISKSMLYSGLADLWMAWKERDPVPTEARQLLALRDRGLPNVTHDDRSLLVEVDVCTYFGILPARFRKLFSFHPAGEFALSFGGRFGRLTPLEVDLQAWCMGRIEASLSALEIGISKAEKVLAAHKWHTSLMCLETGSFTRARHLLAEACAERPQLLATAMEDERFAPIMPMVREMAAGEAAAPGFCKKLAAITGPTKAREVGRVQAIVRQLREALPESLLLDEIDAACRMQDRKAGPEERKSVLESWQRLAKAWPLDPRCHNVVHQLLAEDVKCKEDAWQANPGADREAEVEASEDRLHEWLEISPPNIAAFFNNLNFRLMDCPRLDAIDDSGYYPAHLTGHDYANAPQLPPGQCRVIGTYVADTDDPDPMEWLSTATLLGCFAADSQDAEEVARKFLADRLEIIRRDGMDARVLLFWALRLGLSVTDDPPGRIHRYGHLFLMEAVASMLDEPIDAVADAFAAAFAGYFPGMVAGSEPKPERQSI